jgi:hypothetical protein
MGTQVKPGTPTPDSGIWKRSGDGREVAVSKGDRMPPGREGRHDTWTIKTPTRQPKR